MPKTCCPLRNQWKNQFKLNSQAKTSQLCCVYAVCMLCVCCAYAVRMLCVCCAYAVRMLCVCCAYAVVSGAALALGKAQIVLSFEAPMEKSIQIESPSQNKPI